MVSTREALEILRSANPGSDIGEEDVRRAIRSGHVSHPPLFAGRLVWSPEALRSLALHLGLSLPTVSGVDLSFHTKESQ